MDLDPFGHETVTGWIFHVIVNIYLVHIQILFTFLLLLLPSSILIRFPLPIFILPHLLLLLTSPAFTSASSHLDSNKPPNLQKS